MTVYDQTDFASDDETLREWRRRKAAPREGCNTLDRIAIALVVLSLLAVPVIGGSLLAYYLSATP